MSEAEGGARVATARRCKPYPGYRDSGVEWLGEVPTHWQVLAVARLIDRIEQGWSPVAEDRPAGPDDWAVIKLSAVDNGVFHKSEHKALPADLSPDTRYEIRDGDFLLTRANTPDLVGDVCVVRGAGSGLMLCDLVYRLQLRCDDVIPEFLAYWFLSPTGRYQIEVDARGSSRSMVKVSQGLIRAWTVVLPPFAEQRTIGTFLDRETARIDALVAKKKRLVVLLHEKRTALITQAVTNGLDPNVPMKHSGVESLGEIPAHWDVRRLKFVLAAPLKYGANEAAELDDPDLPRYVRITDIDENDGLRGETFKSLPLEVAREFLLREGDLLFARSGATAGKTFLYRRSWGTCAYAGYLIRAHLDIHKCSPEFIRYFTASSSYWQWLASAFVQATIQNVSAERYASLWLPLPPLAEQRAIAAFVEREAARINALAAIVRDAIDRLKELRSALISAAVTGKIDVRREVA